MKNRVGSPVSGKNYFHRESLYRRCCRKLNAGANLYLSAPRRSGKTSFMLYLRDNPCEGYEFVFINTEPIEDPQIFFKQVLHEALNSTAISKLDAAKSKSKKIIDSLLGRFKSIEGFGMKLDLGEKPVENYAEIFNDLLQKLDPEEVKLVLMIDEFPSTVNNIAKKHGEATAVHFLQENRAIRQTANQAIQTIYTGSIGLPALVSKLKASSSVNDLQIFEIPPFTNEEATELIKTLLTNERIAFEAEVVTALLAAVKWLMPFFIQLTVNDLIDIYDETQQTLTAADVQKAVERSSSQRSNMHFESYYARIETSFSKEESALAHRILRQIAQQDAVLPADLDADSDNDSMMRYVLDTLELDGYISNISGAFRFNSPILQQWWLRFAYV